MTTKLEQAARQIIVDWDSGIHLHEAITAMREALSEPVRKCDGLLCNECGEYKKKYKGLPGLTEKDLCVCEPAEQDCGGAQHHRYAGSFGD